MTDSFFGFNTSVPCDDDGGGGIESEGEYDALNCETFGEASRGDWENFHENLVRLSESESVPDTYDDNQDGNDSDLDMNFGGVGIENCDISHEENESRVLLDPNVWASPDKIIPHQQFHNNPGFQNLNNIAQNFQNQAAISQIKMCSLEEIEQDIMKQQQQKVTVKSNGRNEKNRQQPHPMLRTQPKPAIHPLHPILNHPVRLPHGYPPPCNFIPPPNNAKPQNFGLIGQRLPPIVHQQLQQQNMQSNFNQRLVQEIQQNHPMLSHIRHNNNNNNKHYQQHHNHQQLQQNHNRHNGNINMNEFDEYANLMSERDKQWLLNIQYLQLNADTPYINDFYFTIYKDRQTKTKKTKESKTYTDNTMNHPLAQQMLNRYGLINNRERRNSENKNDSMKDQAVRTYTPLQFENSLGKLQCGSVTAPRKIIDMEVVVGETAGTQSNKSNEITTQRKSRQILLHVENLYELVLKLEDLQNPLAIEAALILKEKRERERALAAGRKELDNLNNVSLNSTDSLSMGEPDNFDELLAKLIPGLCHDKITSILSVRKGKLLLKRIQTILSDHPYRWNVWCAIFSSLPLISKKDREDIEGLLFSLFTEFESHIHRSHPINITQISDTLINSDKILSLLFTCKFLLSSTLTLIIQMEYFYKKSLVDNESSTWRQFLINLSKIVPDKQDLKLNRENRMVEPIQSHFLRFTDIDMNRFLTLITVDKN